ncbi:hypothetical protein ACIODS_04305 [Micromonospora chalcea]|uniref:hypothetical protein n=1 Tax=Micromonospora chalcea TaxID=1874 RepID=UPI0037F675E7
MREAVGWITVERASVIVAALALLGIFYSWRSAQAAKASADAALSQAASAREQVDLGRQQIELLLRQIAQTEEAQQATRQAQQEALQPMVVVDIVPAPNDRSVMMLVIENIGPSIARNVRIDVSPPPARSFDRADGKQMHEWHIFTQGIKTMPPGHRMEFLFDIGFQRFKPDVPTDFTFVVDAEGPFGPAPQLTFDIDLNALRESWIGQTTIGKVVEQMEKGNRNLSELTSAVRQLNPDVRGAQRSSRQEALAELEAAE